MFVFLMCSMNNHLSDISRVVWEVNTDGKTEVLVTVVSITWRQNLWEGIPRTWVVKHSPLCLFAMDEPGQDQWAEGAINKKEGGEDRRQCKDKSVVWSATPRKETKWKSCDHLERFPFHNFRYQVIFFYKQGLRWCPQKTLVLECVTSCPWKSGRALCSRTSKGDGSGFLPWKLFNLFLFINGFNNSLLKEFSCSVACRRLGKKGGTENAPAAVLEVVGGHFVLEVVGGRAEVRASVPASLPEDHWK